MKHFFLLLIALLSTSALLAADFEVNGIAYIILKANIVEVTSKDKEYAGAISIPSIVTCNGVTFKVTKIGDKAFYKCPSLTSVTAASALGTTWQGWKLR